MAFERLIRAAKDYFYYLWLLKDKKLSVYVNYVFKYRNHVIIAFYFGPPILLFSPIRLLVFQKVPTPILLFSPIRLLIFQKISHLYFYSEPSSIRNSRVGR